jgi:FAD:protein FMN transferase
MACQFEVILPEAGAAWLGASRDVLTRLDEIEARLSVFRDTSEISFLNQNANRSPVSCDPELMRLLLDCQALSVATDGAFDITSTPLSRCWGFMRREGRLPSTTELETALGAVGMGKVQLEPEHGTVQFRASDLELNLGAIGKGHALDLLGGDLRATGVDQALLCAGKSSLLALGGDWPVDLRSPQVADHPLARLVLRDSALATSGAGEQFVIIDGRRYGHIIDPRTGWPAVGLLSVSVVTREAARADALATAFFVGGLDLVRRYCEAHDEVLAVVTPDDEQGRPQVFGKYRGVRLEIA